MKTITVILLVLLEQISFSQNSDWIFRNPNPQNDFYGIKFFDQNTGYVVGSNGVILKNTTGSNNWINIPSGTTNNLYGLYFFDVNHGYVVGQGEIVMYTSNGGTSWISYTIPNGLAFRSISFINPTTGFVAGDNGSLYKTTTGIAGFTPINITSSNLHCVFALDSLRIFACGDSGKFLRSTDGGNNWTISSVISYNLTGVFFTTALTGYLIANQSGSLKTTNGGVNWSTFNFGYGSPSNVIKFINQNTGYAVGNNGPILKTTNSGMNWVTWCSDQLFSGNSYTDICAVDSSHAYTCGTRGWILKSVDSIPNQNIHYSVSLGGCRDHIYSISFLNENTGEVVASGRYLYTTNGGINWTINLVGSNSWFEGGGSITGAILVAPNSGYRTLYYGGMGFNQNSIQNTTDGGVTWNGTRGYSVMNGFPFPGFCEADGVTFLVVNYRRVMKNSGSGWDTVFTTPYDLRQINFANANTGAVLGGDSVPGVTRTTNGGANWIFSAFGNTQQGNDIQMLSSGVGYVAGDSSVILKTYNYGANWTLLPVNGNFHISKIYFASDNTGWYLGQTGSYPYSNGKLFYTANGGANFVQLQSLQNLTVTGFSFVNSLTGFVCGDTGVVLRTTNGGLTFVNTTSLNVPDKFSLSQNYPNPFNPSTVIKFQIPTVGNGRDRSVQLRIYDVLGKEVETLVNQQMQPGSYSVDWNGTNYPSGVYFYQLIVSSEQLTKYTETKRMILIK